MQRLLADYHDYLVGECGLVAGTIRRYEHRAQLFLTEHSDRGSLELRGLGSQEVTNFVVRQCRRRSVASAKNLVGSMLRFCYLQGVTVAQLAPAVPAVADWHGAGLPRELAAATVVGLLGSCDRRTARGRRDYAIVIGLARRHAASAPPAGILSRSPTELGRSGRPRGPTAVSVARFS